MYAHAKSAVQDPPRLTARWGHPHPRPSSFLFGSTIQERLLRRQQRDPAYSGWEKDGSILNCLAMLLSLAPPKGNRYNTTVSSYGRNERCFFFDVFLDGQETQQDRVHSTSHEIKPSTPPSHAFGWQLALLYSTAQGRPTGVIPGPRKTHVSMPKEPAHRACSSSLVR